MAASMALDTRIPPLEGRLPPPCERDLETLRHFVRSTIGREAPAAPVSPGDFKEVLLTGANGFVGRFLLRELLRQHPALTVHCLVRGGTTEHGFERLRGAMVEAEIWDESYGSRLKVVAGDIHREGFGLSDTDFQSLCRRVDAVYHSAARLSLFSSYAALRETNVLALRNILALCLRTRLKPVFQVSTLGIFPEYVCNFAREFRHARIHHHMQPDLANMKRIFPLGVLGYAWTKLVAEQILLFARSAGLPVAVFRLPQTGMSSTGFTRADDVMVRLYFAANQMRMAPPGLSVPGNSAPVDTLGSICAAISMNPRRQFALYHCCNPQAPHDDFRPADFGFYWREVSYASFRRAGQARGEGSPLHGLWSLLDQFAPYWFAGSGDGFRLPICDRAVHEDSPRPIEWPAPLIAHARSHDWVRRRGREWPHPVLRGRLDFERLLAGAEDCAERSGVAFEAALPPWMRTGLEQLVAALNAPEAGIRPERVPYLVYGLNQLLRSNVALCREGRQHPQIEGEAILRPVFIVGINRTGTTFLHRLMARDRRFRTLRRYELAEPVLASGEYARVAWTPGDPRRAHQQEILDAAGVVEKLAEMHRIDIDEPEEDFPLLRLSFIAWIETARHHVPAYARWLAATGSKRAYAHHRRVMRHFTWQRRQREPALTRQWLLKMPFHLMELEALLETYPDARFIQTHREPAHFMGSWNSLVERIRSIATEPRPPHDIGEEQLAFMSGMLDRAARFRSARPELESRWVDVRYTDLVEDPLAVVGNIYERFGWELESKATQAMEEWRRRQAEQRRQEPSHRYRLEDYGLTPARVDAAFASYRDFVAARGLAKW